MTTAAPGQAASLGSRVKERLRQLWPHELPFGHLHRDQDGIPVRMPEAGYGRSRTTHLSVSRLGIDAALTLSQAKFEVRLAAGLTLLDLWLGGNVSKNLHAMSFVNAGRMLCLLRIATWLVWGQCTVSCGAASVSA